MLSLTIACISSPPKSFRLRKVIFFKSATGFEEAFAVFSKPEAKMCFSFSHLKFCLCDLLSIFPERSSSYLFDSVHAVYQLLYLLLSSPLSVYSNLSSVEPAADTFLGFLSYVFASSTINYRGSFSSFCLTYL